MYLVCPLCGKLAHLSCFTPDEYSDDIECVEMRSLGRAKGFEVTRRFSALDDKELMELIISRCRAILKIAGEEIIKPEDADIEDELRAEIEELKEFVDEYEEEMDGLLARVNAVLTEVYEDEFSTLEAALKALIVEYREAMEEAEDADEEEEEDDEDEDDDKPLSGLDREILIAEREEAEAKNDGDF